MDKCPCGKPAIGNVNGHPFCDNPDHIDGAMRDSLSPLKKALNQVKHHGGKGMKNKDWDRSLDKVTDARTDKVFLTKLSKWLVELSGNVNAAQRLNVISLKLKQLSDP